jgi:tRNA1Val (adenine37-N6)-methyltransferase
MFHFKQFSVRHDRAGMKVGTDGTLLGAWVTTDHAMRILDIGTGTGLIALMVAQRTPASACIDAVEPDAGACADASENFAQSPWASRLHLHECALQEFLPTAPYDLIVSNPPYFVNSLKAPDPSRSKARHTDSLSVSDVVTFSIRWLKSSGRLALVLPVAEAQFCIAEASVKFHPVRICKVHSKPEKPAERWLMELRAAYGEVMEETLVLTDGHNQRTGAYRALTGSFYLKG